MLKEENCSKNHSGREKDFTGVYGRTKSVDKFLIVLGEDATRPEPFDCEGSVRRSITSDKNNQLFAIKMTYYEMEITNDN